ncbi:MAG: S41 family peptidase [Gemmatimonadales bacterium]
MKAGKSFRGLLLTVLLTGAAACASAGGNKSASAEEPLAPGIALATFDRLWTMVRDTYVDTAFVSTKWVAVRDSLRPRAAGITTRGELDELLAETLHSIADSHFYIIPAKVATEESSAGKTDGRGSTGISLRMAGGQAVVWKIDAGSPAAVAGIRAGDRIVGVGERNISTSLKRIKAMPEAARPRAMSELLYSLNGALSPAVGESLEVTVVSHGGKASNLRTLVAIPRRGTVSQFGNLPPIAGLVQASRIPAQSGSACVGMIAFNIWLPALARELEHAMDSVRGCRGVVIDLRGNPGGVGAMVMGFGGYFVDSTLSLGTMRTRQVSLRFAINPRRSRADGTQTATFTGPLAILVDPMTASTSEIFATGMQRIGRARVFGERSAGAALPALMERLPSGDVFVHAVADFTDPTGKRIEGTGVEPDELIPLSGKDLSDGRDTALEAAMRWITADSAGRPASH